MRKEERRRGGGKDLRIYFWEFDKELEQTGKNHKEEP
jgi:hypothetical protein